ncbi:hypothetical protein Bxe_B2100 [Paraburkholderia xenovorans LB400]|uniref:Uncharacterized protein n=1 Tax=Paraburkholderia xenovorans (strain LB400) TaxID=266265 RepID=Q13PV2_PARXL|nr:hypothetical protein Bxe_B2100 [Paraburkholderia xenovorans LB400]
MNSQLPTDHGPRAGSTVAVLSFAFRPRQKARPKHIDPDPPGSKGAFVAAGTAPGMNALQRSQPGARLTREIARKYFIGRLGTFAYSCCAIRETRSQSATMFAALSASAVMTSRPNSSITACHSAVPTGKSPASFFCCILRIVFTDNARARAVV